MQIFFAPGSIALASMIALEEAGADHVVTRLDFRAAEQRGAEYLAINPKGRVPALITDQGVLTETPAILSYVAAHYPDAGLRPADAFAAARLDEFCAFLCATVHVSHAHGSRGARWSDDPAVVEALKARVAQNMGDHFAMIEAQMVGPWVFDSYSVADPYLFTLSGWLERDGVDITRFPKVEAHRAAMEARPAVQRAVERMHK